MENLVLIRVVHDLAAGFVGARLADVRQDGPQRLRLVFEGAARGRTIVISFRPGLCWIGRPGGPPAARMPPGAFAGCVRRSLVGVALSALDKPAAERVVTLRFADGQALVVELQGGSPDLLLLDAEGRVQAAARRSRSSRARGEIGSAYHPPAAPAGRPDAFTLDAGAVDEALREGLDAGETVARAIERRVFGVGAAGAELLAAESTAPGIGLGAIVVSRLRMLCRAECDPVSETPQGAAEAAEVGRLDPGECRLWPWNPPFPPGAGRVRTQGEDAAATAGMFFETIERAHRLRDRSAALASLVDREERRTEDAMGRAREDLSRFSDPERLRSSAEALLAGASRARREGEAWIVPDPYDPGGREIAVEARGGVGVVELGEQLFRAWRRSRRGEERARARVAELAARVEVLGRLREQLEAGPDIPGLSDIEKALRAAGVAVGLDRVAGKGSAVSTRPPRIEGVRVVISSDGLTILVGRSGRENDRLTFKLAGPEDFWFHALRRAGAHVIVRNEGRATRPPQATLREAAELAAWFSEAREEREIDVQWTRRKYVRRARGSPPGTVLVKKSETVRVRVEGPPGGLQRI